MVGLTIGIGGGLLLIAGIIALFMAGKNKKKSDSIKTFGWMALVLGGLIFFFMGGLADLDISLEPASVVPSGTGTAGLVCADSTATVTFSSVDALNKGTAVTSTFKIKRNDGVTQSVTGNSSSGLAVGDQLTILSSKASYVDQIDTYTVPCGGGTVEILMPDQADATIKIFNDLGNVMTDGTSPGPTTVNQSDMGVGGSATMELKLTGSDNDVTGDLIFVVENIVGANVSDVTISGLGGVQKVSVPDFYSIQNAGGEAHAFRIPSIEGARTARGDMTITLGSGKGYTGEIYTTAYVEQAFEETDGLFKVGVENEDNTVKYVATYDYDFYIE